jgi:hypothetical protein
MTYTSVSEVQKAVGFTEADAAALKKVRLVWQRLEALRRKAETDSTQLVPYYDTLEKSLAQARRQTPLHDDPTTDAQKFWNWYAEQCSLLNVPDIEQRRGSGHQSWCEKWLPAVYKEFAEAVQRVIELPTEQGYSDLQEVSLKMLKAYVGAIQSG